MAVTALAPWFGSNRMLAEEVGIQLRGCEWVGVPFAGGMAEVPHIQARTMVVNDKHRHIINLAGVVASGVPFETKLEARTFHPDWLLRAQHHCQKMEDAKIDFGYPAATFCEEWALSYFIAVWMGRSGVAGTRGEFNGGLALRWNAGGGDSAVRYQSAIQSLKKFRESLKRCTFSTLDVFEFLGKCHDKPKHGVYCDPPFPGPGDAYKHTFGEGVHRQLAQRLSEFTAARVVCRFYDVPLIRELYPESRWKWNRLTGRKQTNDEAPEVLLVLN